MRACRLKGPALGHLGRQNWAVFAAGCRIEAVAARASAVEGRHSGGGLVLRRVQEGRSTGGAGARSFEGSRSAETQTQSRPARGAGAAVAVGVGVGGAVAAQQQAAGATAEAAGGRRADGVLAWATRAFHRG